MHLSKTKQLSDFYVAGINYRKTDATLRGQFAINDDQYRAVISKASDYGINEFFILSTCNRTEIYGFAADVKQLAALLCSETKSGLELFYQSAYIKQGKQAIEHLFHVGAGLDSQVLGDYEIVGQIKHAAKLSKSHGFIGSSLERTINAVLQTSKAIKNNTQLSGGTVSVSFGAVQYIKQQVKDVKNKKILLVGIGKIGSNTCKNVVDYLQTRNVVLINRTLEKASRLANELGLQYASINDLGTEVAGADIILVATNSALPIILKEHLENKGQKLIIDLSIPYNVEEQAHTLPNIHLVNVDELARLKDETLSQRTAEIPKAVAIINKNILDIFDWFEMRKHVPVLTAVKVKLNEIHTSVQYKGTASTKHSDVRIQKVLNGMASKMRVKNNRGCYYIEAINEFLAPPTKN